MSVKRIFLWIYLLIKKQLKNPAILVLLIGIPIVSGIAANMNSLSGKPVPNVGIVVNDNDSIAVDTANSLINGDYSVKFYISPSRDELKKDIMNKKAECGYVFGENLSEKILNNTYEGSVELIVNSSDFIASMTNEMVFAAMFKNFAPDVAKEYLKKSDIFSRNKDIAITRFEQNYEKYKNSDETFHIDFSMLDDSMETVEIKDSTGRFPLKGIMAVLIYVAGMFGMVTYYMDKEKGTFVTMTESMNRVGRVLYAFIPTLLFGISAQLALLLSKDEAVLTDVIKMPLYIIAVTAFSWLLGCILRSSRKLISVIPVLVIACFVLCPIFVNVSAYVPALKYVARLLVPYYYIM